MENYEYNLNRVNTGAMSPQDWRDYCFSLLIQLMEDNSDVLVRLKNV